MEQALGQLCLISCNVWWQQGIWLNIGMLVKCLSYFYSFHFSPYVWCKAIERHIYESTSEIFKLQMKAATVVSLLLVSNSSSLWWMQEEICFDFLLPGSVRAKVPYGRNSFWCASVITSLVQFHYFCSSFGITVIT